MLEGWWINKNDLVCITTDNAANIKAFEVFPDRWLACFGHNLNLVTSKALKKRAGTASQGLPLIWSEASHGGGREKENRE